MVRNRPLALVADDLHFEALDAFCDRTGAETPSKIGMEASGPTLNAAEAGENKLLTNHFISIFTFVV
jgi:hypothetical protein